MKNHDFVREVEASLHPQSWVLEGHGKRDLERQTCYERHSACIMHAPSSAYPMARLLAGGPWRTTVTTGSSSPRSIGWLPSVGSTELGPGTGAGGCPAVDVSADGCPAVDVGAGGCTAVDVGAGGCPAVDVNAGGCTAVDVNAGGCTAADPGACDGTSAGMCSCDGEPDSGGKERGMMEPEAPAVGSTGPADGVVVAEEVAAIIGGARPEGVF